MKIFGCLCLFFVSVGLLGAEPGAPPPSAAPLNGTMDDYSYPYPVSYLPLEIEGQQVRLAYMDVPPAGKVAETAASFGPEEPRVIVLFHGKNFPSAYWKDTIAALSQAGFRVIVPDQIGFGKSSKPSIHYSFHELAMNTRHLLDTLKITRVDVVGHSMGGMLGARFALMFPSMISHLVLEDPIGLEDYRLSVVYVPTSERYEQVQQQTVSSIHEYHAAYYADWKPDFEEWVQTQFRLQQGPDAAQVALASALTSQMIYEQPVCYEFYRLITPTLLIVGMQDRTAPGKERMTPEVAAELGNFPLLGEKTAQEMPRGKLVELDHVGHVPHLEAPDLFHRELLKFLLQKPPGGER